MVAGFPELIMKYQEDKKMNKRVQVVKLDLEWIELIKQARELGLTVEEVRVFINKTSNMQKMTP